jgi:uncharacterized membrane protein
VTAPAGRYFLAAALATAGIAVAAGVVLRFVDRLPEPGRFLAPGSVTIAVTVPDAYVIWHEHRTLYEGRAYDLPASLPGGARLHVTGPGGGAVDVQPASGMKLQSGTQERASVARFEAREAGPYRVAVEGDFAPRVMVVGTDFFWPLFGAIAAAVAALVVGVGAGASVALYAFLDSTAGGARAAAGAVTPERELALRRLTALVYGLQAVSLVVGVTSIAGVIVNYLKRREVAGTWLESHFDWQIRTFWLSLLWGLAGLATAAFLVGFLVLLVTAVWFVYRVVKGWTDLNEGRQAGTGS